MGILSNEIVREIAIEMRTLGMEKDTCLGVVHMLMSEEQAEEMLAYLREARPTNNQMVYRKMKEIVGIEETYDSSTILSVKTMRESDAHTISSGISGKELMYRAGESIFKSVQWQAPVAIVCGSGNNAGDGYVLAKLLHDSDIECELILLSDKFSEDGEYYFRICQENNITAKLWSKDTVLSNYVMIVDCIFGTGFRGSVDGVNKEVIEAINNSGAYVISVDINSGLNGDSGMADLCVHSDITLSIGWFQPGHFLNMAKDVMKEKRNLQIGIEPVGGTYKLIEANDLKDIFTERKNFSNKGTYGYTALIGGSKRYSGAIRLAYMANAAMRAGAGVVKVALPNSLYRDVTAHILESTIYPLSDDDGEMVFVENEIADLIRGVKTIAFGMGIGVTEETAKILNYILAHYKGTLIVDADGLTILSEMDVEKIKNSGCRLVLTPHLKEFSRLTGESIESILDAPIQKAKEYARSTNTIVLLKGPTSIITDGVDMYLVDAGCPGMATAGSGDVLSGIVAAICAYLPNLPLATATAAYINGKAGELAQKKYGPISMIASDTVACISQVIKSIVLFSELDDALDDIENGRVISEEEMRTELDAI